MTTSVGVFCGSRSGDDPIFVETARALGEQLAEAGFALVYGAGEKGVMGAIADAALSRGGKVHGFIPLDMYQRGWFKRKLSRLETHQDIHERQKRMYRASKVTVTLPGGYGTLVECLEVLTWSQLGYHGIEPKPQYILNLDGYYNPLVEMLYKVAEKGFADAEDPLFFTVVHTVDELMAELVVHK